jgi:deoxyribodipyrimidine photo-lyase
MSRRRPLPALVPGDEVAWVRRHLGHLAAESSDEIVPSPSFRGGQQAADAALAAFDVSGYARDRNEVWPRQRRGASRLSPYIRHGLLSLREVWNHVADGPSRDVAKYRDELLWQEYARHLYARLGPRLSRPLRAEPPTGSREAGRVEQAWNRRMACVDLAWRELTDHGWMVNQTRMWLASQWTVRHGWDWREGEDVFFTHLLDGSRAANRLGWQWTVGTGTGRAYGFSRAQVMRRAPGVCGGCALREDCPIEQWPDAPEPAPADPPSRLRRDDDPEATGGPRSPASSSAARQPPSLVWLTAESLGDADPALADHPELPAVFVWDEALLARLALSGKRMVFLAEALADLSTRREVVTYLADASDVLADAGAAVTFAPVPGFRTRAAQVRPTVVHPYPWLVRPGAGPVTSFTAWRRYLRV